MFGNLVDVPGEKLFLIIKTGTPSEICATLEIFSETMAHHVRSVNAFARLRVMSATSGMDVVIAGPPAHLRGIDPAFHLECEFGRAFLDMDVANLRDGFRAAGKFNFI